MIYDCMTPLTYKRKQNISRINDGTGSIPVFLSNPYQNIGAFAGNNTFFAGYPFIGNSSFYGQGGPVFVDGRYWKAANGKPISFTRHYPWRNGKGYTVYSRDGKAYKYDNNGKFVGSTKGSIYISSKNLLPRQRANTSKTAVMSERLEKGMRNYIQWKAYKNNHISNSNYNIPFIPSKAVLIDGNLVSTNQLDSLAKYWGMHNADPQVSQYPLKGTQSTRKLNRNEMLGLARQETFFGANPYYNTSNIKPPYSETDLMNANYIKNYGSIPAEYYVRDFHYNDRGVDLSTPPLLDAFRYFAQGDYNRGDKNHTSDVNAQGKAMWGLPVIQEWYNTSGKQWVKKGYEIGSSRQHNP